MPKWFLRNMRKSQLGRCLPDFSACGFYSTKTHFVLLGCNISRDIPEVLKQISCHSACLSLQKTSVMQLIGQIMSHMHAAIFIHVSRHKDLFLCLFSIFGIHYKMTSIFIIHLVFLFLSSLFCIPRSRPSSNRSFRSPHRDSQTPSDSHLLHYKQG